MIAVIDHRDTNQRAATSGFSIDCACGERFHGITYFGALLEQRIHRSEHMNKEHT